MLKIKYFIEIGSDIEIQIKPDDLRRFKEPVEAKQLEARKRLHHLFYEILWI